MRKFLQRILREPVTRIAQKVSSAPKKDAVFKSLTDLISDLRKNKRGLVRKFDHLSEKIIVLSDMHKGARDLVDNFRLAEKNYLTALNYYYENNYTLICLGDCEELWENEPKILMQTNRNCLEAEVKFLQANRYFRAFGNHDLEWKYDFPRNLYLKPIFGSKLDVIEGLILEINYNNESYYIFMTHGHQGDQRSDGNAFSKWFVAAIWTPIQRYLDVNINSVSDSIELVDKHNIIMYDWSATQKNLIFISGHTHKPVFASLDHVEMLTKELANAKEANNAELIKSLSEELEKRKAEYAGKQFHKTMAIPSYFNSGCCCFADGDITGIEIADGEIRLIKWKDERIILEHSDLNYIFDELNPNHPS